MNPHAPITGKELEEMKRIAWRDPLVCLNEHREWMILNEPGGKRPFGPEDWERIAMATKHFPRCLVEIERLTTALEEIATREEHAELCQWHLDHISCNCHVAIAKNALPTFDR